MSSWSFPWRSSSRQIQEEDDEEDDEGEDIDEDIDDDNEEEYKQEEEEDKQVENPEHRNVDDEFPIASQPESECHRLDVDHEDDADDIDDYAEYQSFADDGNHSKGSKRCVSPTAARLPQQRPSQATTKATKTTMMTTTQTAATPNNPIRFPATEIEESTVRQRCDSGITLGDDDMEDLSPEEPNHRNKNNSNSSNHHQQQDHQSFASDADSKQFRIPHSCASSVESTASIGPSATSRTKDHGYEEGNLYGLNHNQDDEEEEVDNHESYTTTMVEKQSLLALAAEHDRVDILQAILNGSDEPSSSNSNSNNNSNNKTPSDPPTSKTTIQQALLAGFGGSVPPLHIAMAFGSVNATNCLLRMGADPSIRPPVNFHTDGTISTAATTVSSSLAPPTPTVLAHAHRYKNYTAWELVFAERSSPFTVQPSKREGLRHAFTAEALRAIGSDEASRLQQLLEAGMPPTTDLAGKSLYDWTVEMNATRCEELLRPEGVVAPTTATATLTTTIPTGEQTTELQSAGNGDRSTTAAKEPTTTTTTTTTTTDTKLTGRIRERSQEPTSIPHLTNTLEEYESLARALSSSLDALGEEVAVSSGLLLMGSGAQALASHVKSLKQQKETKYEDLDRWREVVGNSLDELAYWVQQCGPAGDVIAAQRFHVTTVPSNTHSNFANETKHCQYLQAQISATQQKIRLLRVSMTDLSEEHARNMAEVERRGLLGGMTLVRGLRDEIRELDYRITELQQQEADCRAKLSLVQAKLREQKAVSTATEPTDKLSSKEGEAMNGSNAKLVDRNTSKEGTDNYDTNRPIERLPSGVSIGKSADTSVDSSETASERIQSGKSTAIVLRPTETRGFFPVSLWQILLRIIGLGDDLQRTTNRAQPALII